MSTSQAPPKFVECPTTDIVLKPPAGELKRKDLSNIDPVSRENVYEEEFDKYTHLNVELHKAQFGVYESKPAALLVFRFLLQYRSGWKRIKSVNIEIKFTREGAGNAPYIVELEPLNESGDIFTEQISHTVRGNLHAGTQSIADFGTGGQVSFSNSYVREYAMTIMGRRKSSDHGIYDRAVWHCEETKKKAKGVPPVYYGAVIIHCDGRFSGEVDVVVKQGSWTANLSHTFETVIGRGPLCPVIFDPRRPFGEPIPFVTDFKALNLKEQVSGVEKSKSTSDKGKGKASVRLDPYSGAPGPSRS